MRDEQREEIVVGWQRLVTESGATPEFELSLDDWIEVIDVSTGATFWVEISELLNYSGGDLPFTVPITFNPSGGVTVTDNEDGSFVVDISTPGTYQVSWNENTYPPAGTVHVDITEVTNTTIDGEVPEEGWTFSEDTLPYDIEVGSGGSIEMGLAPRPPLVMNWTGYNNNQTYYANGEYNVVFNEQVYVLTWNFDDYPAGGMVQTFWTWEMPADIVATSGPGLEDDQPASFWFRSDAEYQLSVLGSGEASFIYEVSSVEPLPTQPDPPTYGFMHQDWRGLGGTPAGWTSAGGTPTFTADGVRPGSTFGDTIQFNLNTAPNVATDEYTLALAFVSTTTPGSVWNMGNQMWVYETDFDTEANISMGYTSSTSEIFTGGSVLPSPGNVVGGFANQNVTGIFITVIRSQNGQTVTEGYANGVLLFQDVQASSTVVSMQNVSTFMECATNGVDTMFMTESALWTSRLTDLDVAALVGNWSYQG